MKLGTENKTKTLIAAGLLILAVVLLIRAFTGSGGEQAPPAPAATAKVAPPQPNATTGTAKRGGSKPTRKTARPLLAQTLDPTLRFDLLKSSEDLTYKGTGRNIFSSQAPPPDIPKPLPADIHPQAQAPPPPPPIPLKFYGFASQRGGNKQIFLSKGDDFFVAREGDTVDRRYKILRITPNSVEVQDVLTNNTQTLPLVLG